MRVTVKIIPQAPGHRPAVTEATVLTLNAEGGADHRAAAIKAHLEKLGHKLLSLSHAAGGGFVAYVLHPQVVAAAAKKVTRTAEIAADMRAQRQRPRRPGAAR